MFVGRKKELNILENLYQSNKFEMLIMYGRRRVGKSYLLAHFASLHPNNVIFFSADKSCEKNNVRNFCTEMNRVLNVGNYITSFETWQNVYSYFNENSSNERLVIIIDEFTYLSASDSSFDSQLQNAIDRIFKQKNIMLILCGSQVSVIEDIIDNSSRPLYGRKTAQMKLETFSFNEAKEFFPHYDYNQAITAFSILGGMPLYLSLFDDKLSIRDNIIKVCLSDNGYLFNEAESVLRMELNETTFYKNILVTIQSGSSTFNQICTKIGNESAKIAKYLNVLINLGIIKKEIPIGEKEKSRNTLYCINDNYFAFYFKFIFPNRNILNGLISPEIFFDKELTEEKLTSYIGFRFEQICSSYLQNKFRNGEMPFFAQNIGRWWGNNPIYHRQDEIDIVALDDDNAMFCECKFTNQKFTITQYNKLLESGECINRPNKYFMIFSKNGVTEELQQLINKHSNIFVVTSDML